MLILSFIKNYKLQSKAIGGGGRTPFCEVDVVL